MKISFLIHFIFFTTYLLGQTCLFDSIYQQKMIAFESYNSSQYLSASERSPIYIPVVVHIVWHQEIENISDHQVYTQMQILNRAFQPLPEDFSNLRNELKEIAGNPNYHFCLASFDPEGNPTSGITRTKTMIEEIGTSKDLYHSNSGGHTAWDTERYLNIWVCNMNSQLLGFGTTPNTVDESKDGVIVNYRYFGNIGTAFYSNPYNSGKTLVHEIGHYLNLIHPWGIYQGDCDEDDLVEDTPIQYRAYYGCPIDEIDDCNNEVLEENYMSFNDDACISFFTKGQVERMSHALSELRPLLRINNSSSCTENNNPMNEEPIISVFPNPIITSFVISVSIPLENSHFELVNLNGQTILKEPISPTFYHRVEGLDELTDGLYFLKIFSRDKTVFTKKIVLQ